MNQQFNTTLKSDFVWSYILFDKLRDTAVHNHFWLHKKQSTLTNLYSKTCLKRPLKIDKSKALETDGSLMKIESIKEC